jgi:hypothetical protein
VNVWNGENCAVRYGLKFHTLNVLFQDDKKNKRKRLGGGGGGKIKGC